MTVIYDTILEADYNLDEEISIEGTIESAEPFSASLEIPETAGSVAWGSVTDKPFESIDTNTLKVENGVMRVHTTDDAEEDNTKPITSSGVYVIVGNIDALLTQI